MSYENSEKMSISENLIFETKDKTAYVKFSWPGTPNLKVWTIINSQHFF